MLWEVAEWLLGVLYTPMFSVSVIGALKLTLLLSLVVFGLLFVSFTLYIAHVHRKYAHIPGPELRGFYSGNAPQLQEYYKREEYSHRLLLKWANQFQGTFRVFLYHVCMVVVTDRNTVKEFLTKSKYGKGRMSYKLLASVCGERFLGQGLVTNVDHGAWSKRRSVLNPAFHKKYLRLLIDQFNSTADQWVDSMRNEADDGSMFDAADYLSRVTLDIIGKVGFDFDTGGIADNESRFPSSIRQVLEGYSKQFKDPLFNLRPSRRDLRKAVRESVQFLRSRGRRLVEARMRDMEEGKDVPQDILTFIIRCNEVDHSLTMEDMLDEFCTLFVAGQETTANTLTFLLRELGQHPHVYERMVEEIDGVMKGGSYVDFDMLSGLQYTTQVIKETLRLYPVAPGTSRDVNQDCVVDGVKYPKGCFLVVSFYIMHRLEKYYKDPDKFDPDRFDPSASRPLFTYMPFSLGVRSCAGQQFALMEAKILLCKFLSEYTFNVEPSESLQVHESLTLRPRDGCRMTIARRRH